ncbi:zinc-binding dehydrogenase [Bifidobacterium mongoliense]|uniref:zinc-binding dehydrogenase n=1 Tax=Bifidobacterium mongoliense TaxID=518643 RepID=UPI0019D3BA97|nr:zinc-binding dehydrogenase [Bifidobacterium mongoliense]
MRGARGNIGLYAKVMRPFGRIAAIDDEWHLDWYVLKDKALSWEWEFMFARSKHHAADMVRQHDILEQIAHMIDAGDLVSTVTTRFEGIDAAHLRRAHALVETGHGIGKVVVGC